VVEQWRPIEGYEGLYEVSNLGQVRSVDRVVVGSRGCQKPLKGKLLKQHAHPKKTYIKVRLSKEGQKRNWDVHRLVAFAFLGSPPEGHIVCHGPKGRRCNEVTNLSWGTREKNNGPDMLRDGTLQHGEKHHNAKLNKTQVRVIRRLLESKTMTQKEIAAIFDVKQVTVSKIKGRKTWQH
jgi:predicted XRE-type DNA-binding protein